MEQKNFTRNLFAGVFLVFGILFVVMVAYTIGQEKGISKSKFEINVLYRNVGGLMEGAPVLLAGVNIGNVSNINFLDEAVAGRKVKVRLSIFEKYKKELVKSNHFKIKTEGILGEKIVEIAIDENIQNVDFKKPIIGEEPIDVQDLALVFAEAAESLTKTSQGLSNIDINEFSKGMADASETFKKTSEEINNIAEEMQEISIKLKRLLDRVEQKVIDGSLFKVF